MAISKQTLTAAGALVVAIGALVIFATGIGLDRRGPVYPRAEGTVVEAQPRLKYGANSNRDNVDLTVEFIDEQGVPRTVDVVGTSSMHGIGQQIEIEYDPADPAFGQIAVSPVPRMVLLIVAGVALAVAVAAIAGVDVARHFRRASSAVNVQRS